MIETLRAQTDVPIAVGFGVKDKSHIDGLGAVGADAAIVGSTCVARVTDARAAGRDVVEDFRGLLVDLGHVPDSGRNSRSNQQQGAYMIIRNLDEVKTVEWGNGLSRRFLLEADGMGYTVTDTIVDKGTKSRLEYKNHLEACYCIEGSGIGHRDGRHRARDRARARSTRSTSTTRTTCSPPTTRTCGSCACSRPR